MSVCACVHMLVCVCAYVCMCVHMLYLSIFKPSSLHTRLWYMLDSTTEWIRWTLKLVCISTGCQIFKFNYINFWWYHTLGYVNAFQISMFSWYVTNDMYILLDDGCNTFIMFFECILKYFINKWSSCSLYKHDDLKLHQGIW